MLGMLALSITGELYLPIKNRVEELFLAAKVSYKDKDNHQVIIYVDGLDEADCISLPGSSKDLMKVMLMA